MTLAYFYFDFQDSTKQNTTDLLRSLLRQLCNTLFKSWNALKELYNDCEEGRQQPAADVLIDLLVEVINGTEKSFLVIDALDECTEKDDALNAILAVFTLLPNKVNILISSRPESFIEQGLRDIDDEFKCLAMMAARNAEVDKDISDFVRARMQNDRKLRNGRARRNRLLRASRKRPAECKSESLTH